MKGQLEQKSQKKRIQFHITGSELLLSLLLTFVLHFSWKRSWSSL